MPGAKGDFRIGAKLFDEKLAFTLNSPLTRKEIRAAADAAAKVETRAAMYAVSLKALAQAGKPGAPAIPDAPTPEQEQEVIEAALELAYARRSRRPTRWWKTCTAAC